MALKSTAVATREGLRRCWPNAVLCKTCRVLLCVLEQPRVDKSSTRLWLPLYFNLHLSMR